MTKADLSSLISESSKYSEETQYIAKIIESNIILQSEKYKKLEKKIEKLTELQADQYKLLHTIACNFNPIFAFEKNNTED